VPGPKPAPPESRELAVSAARAAAAKQADRIVVLDVRDLIVITDYFVIASGTSDRQVRTIVDEVEKALRGQRVKPVRREGEDQGAWVLLDFVDIVVHVFGTEEREYYDLERLWRDAPVIQWEEAGAASHA
jgi:ribosome-associated protein